MMRAETSLSYLKFLPLAECFCLTHLTSTSRTFTGKDTDDPWKEEYMKRVQFLKDFKKM
jgi:hypothetical protein